MYIKNIFISLTLATATVIFSTSCSTNVDPHPVDQPMSTQIGSEPASEHTPKLDTTSNVNDTVSNKVFCPNKPRKKIHTPQPAQKESISQTENNGTSTVKSKIDWQPNEGTLIRANQLISGLTRELGRKPSNIEMEKILQTHMGISAIRAQLIIDKLG